MKRVIKDQLPASLLLSFFLMAAGLLRLWFMLSNHYLSPDGAHYASLGYHLIHSGAYVSNGSQFPDIIQPPLYPLILGLFSLVLNPVMAGKTVSFLFGMGLIGVVYWFVVNLSQNKRWALITALLVSFNPAFVFISAQVATESLFFFLLFLSFASLLFYLKEEKRKFLIIAALACGLAYLTRPESVNYIVMMVLILLIWRKRIGALLTFSGIVLFFAVLYGLFVFSLSGKVMVYPKIQFVRVHARISRYFLAREQQNGQSSDFKQHLNRVRYALNSSKDELLANALFNGTEQLENQALKGKKGGQRFKEFLSFALTNFIKALKKFLFGLILPPGYLIFLVVGLFKFRWKKHKGLVLYCIFFMLPTALVLLANVEQRFVFFPGLILLPVAAFGLLKFSETFFKPVNQTTRKNGILAVLTLFTLLTTLPAFAEGAKNLSRGDYYFSAGRWLKNSLEKQAVIGATVPQPVFYAGKKYVVLPFAPLDSLQLYLLKKQVDYILIEQKDRFRRPWQTERQKWPEFLELVDARTFDNQKMFLLRVKKE